MKPFSLNPCKISRKLLIKKRDYSNAAETALFKSLSPVDIPLWILQEFPHFFLQNTCWGNLYLFQCYDFTFQNKKAYSACSQPSSFFFFIIQKTPY